jgi:hypothetical protein
VAAQRRAADTRVLGDGGHRRARGETRLRITESAVALHLGVAKGPRTTLQLESTASYVSYVRGAISALS